MNFRDKIFINKSITFILSACLIIGFSLLAPEKLLSQTMQDEASPAVTGITSGRARAIGGAVIALISVIIGWRAKARSNSANLSGTGNKGTKPTQAIIALVLGGIAIILSVIHLSTSAGAVFGSGSGKAGAIVALIIALIGTTLSALALRPKR